MGNRIYGCDDCLAVCPWNKFAAARARRSLPSRATSDNPPLAELLELDDAAFRARFRGTPIKRTGRDRFIRNVLIAAGNSGDPTLVPRVSRMLAMPRRSSARWRCGRCRGWRRAASRACGPLCRSETDAAVAGEWAREAA